eukprot:CAMPEP_0196584334 /NCGR_PEP_ID=MMETSP1081-20130531/46699_1 /TAXON_ID=36882 /ORGANISM="Pyramimonas amylifera, Strain CCMP720" /LENGTH=42 /DNA_ID= /DNA_START= /DNA_END= /DNA_ORIENTATION=
MLGLYVLLGVPMWSERRLGVRLSGGGGGGWCRGRVGGGGGGG